MESFNFLDFMLETYEITRESKETQTMNDNTSEQMPENRGPGRPLSTRVPYRDGAGKKKGCRIIRQPGHETLPRFVGKWFCRSDDEAERDLFRGSMLMLLKPWRNLHEIKTATESFETAYERFMLQADNKCKRVVANVQYFYECSDAAKADRLKAQTYGERDQSGQPRNDPENDENVENVGELGVGNARILEEITEDDIERASLMRFHPRERLYGESAVALGYDVGFFNEDDRNVTVEKETRKVHGDEHEQIKLWQTQLKAITREQIKNTGIIRVSEEEDEGGPSISVAGPGVETRPAVRGVGEPTVLDHQSKQGTERPLLAILNEEQRRAHDIIEERLIEHITSE